MTSEEFKSLILPCYKRMYAVALTILRNSDDAADAVQDTVAVIWRKKEQIDISGSVEAYCSMATRNVCLNKIKRSKPFSEDINDVDIGSSSCETDADTSAASTSRYIRKLLERFSDKQRHILSLSIFNQLSNEEICQVTGESDSNVRQILSRGRTKLKEYLANEFNR